MMSWLFRVFSENNIRKQRFYLNKMIENMDDDRILELNGRLLNENADQRNDSAVPVPRGHVEVCQKQMRCFNFSGQPESWVSEAWDGHLANLLLVT